MAQEDWGHTLLKMVVVSYAATKFVGHNTVWIVLLGCIFSGVVINMVYSSIVYVANVVTKMAQEINHLIQCASTDNPLTQIVAVVCAAAFVACIYIPMAYMISYLILCVDIVVKKLI